MQLSVSFDLDPQQHDESGEGKILTWKKDEIEGMEKNIELSTETDVSLSGKCDASILR